MDITEGTEPLQSEDFVDDDDTSEKEASPLHESCALRLSNAESCDQSASGGYTAAKWSARRRLSIFLLGDMNPDEIDDDEPLYSTATSQVNRLAKSSSRLQRCSPDSPTSISRGKTSTSNDIGPVFNERVAAEPNESQKSQLSVRSIDRAVGIVLSAKRFKSRIKSSAIVPFKPDTPVPPVSKPDVHVQRTPVKEQIRFVFEGPLPYVRCSSLQLKPTMNHLRVNIIQIRRSQDLHMEGISLKTIVGRAKRARRHGRRRQRRRRPCWGWVREGVTPSRKGVRGYYPRENFRNLTTLMCILETENFTFVLHVHS
jgi:hypothetical protein